MSEKLDVVEDRPHPLGAMRVSDLVAEARGSEHITYRRTAPQSLETRYYRPAQMGDYVYVPSFVNRPSLEKHPTPARGNFSYQPLASIGEIHLEFREYGNRRLASFYSGWGAGLYLLSNPLLEILLNHDPHAVEVLTPCMTDPDGIPIEGYTVVMPERVIDAADITRTDISVFRYERPPSVGRSVAFARYESGLMLRDDIDAPTFLDEHGGVWFWSLDLIKEVAAAGIRGVRFVHPCSSSGDHEIGLPADGDLRYPNDW